MVPGVPGPWSARPRIRAVSLRQSAVILARNRVGRIAYTDAGRPAILPVHFRYAGGDIFGRTSWGLKATAWRERSDVAFEVDEVDGLFDWRSVIVRGSIAVLTRHGTREERAEYWRAVEALRELLPDAFTERDPVPDRQAVFAITPLEISGRESSSRA